MKAELLELAVDRIYEAAARPELWRPVLDELAVAANAQGAQLLWHRPAGITAHSYSEGLDEVIEAFFREGWHINNPREMRARKRGTGETEVITDADLFTTDELDREPWQREFLDRFGLRWFSSFNAMTFGDLGPLVLTIERPSAKDPFSTDEVRYLQNSVGHIQRAARLSLSIGNAVQDGMLKALDCVDRPAVLLDEMGFVTAMNAAADLSIDGAVLSIKGRRLKAAASEADKHLNALVENITRPGLAYSAKPLDAIALPRPFGRPLIVQGAPLVRTAREFFNQARAIVFLNDLGSRPVVNPDLLRIVFSLTSAEMRVALLIADGKKLDQVALVLGVSLETCRTHLKSIFGKTNTHSQSELAVLLDRMAGPMQQNKNRQDL